MGSVLYTPSLCHHVISPYKSLKFPSSHNQKPTSALYMHYHDNKLTGLKNIKEKIKDNTMTTKTRRTSSKEEQQQATNITNKNKQKQTPTYRIKTQRKDHDWIKLSLSVRIEFLATTRVTVSPSRPTSFSQGTILQQSYSGVTMASLIQEDTRMRFLHYQYDIIESNNRETRPHKLQPDSTSQLSQPTSLTG